MRNDDLVARASRPLAALLLSCAFALTVCAQKQNQPPPGTLPPEEAATEGRKLATQILAERPAENVVNTGVMTIRNSRNKRTRIPIRFDVVATPDNKWISRYQGGETVATVIHDDARPNEYQLRTTDGSTTKLSGSQANIPFAGSDFSIADLGLEFLHWPQQYLVKKEMRRSRSCNVLASVNPNPAPGGYSRVVSWLDIQSTNGIIYAEAYDAQGKKLKEFIPKKVIQGQLAEMEIDNVQTDSRTTVDFDVEKRQ
jgi:Outer membrane lipoprotein-sorting protein